jgi:hypothetical protein
MELSPSWETTSLSATQEFPSTLWIPKAHYRIHKSPLLVLPLSQTNPIHTTPSYLYSICQIYCSFSLVWVFQTIPQVRGPLWYFVTNRCYPTFLILGSTWCHLAVCEHFPYAAVCLPLCPCAFPNVFVLYAVCVVSKESRRLGLLRTYCFTARSYNPMLEDHIFSAVRDCLFNILATTFHIWRPSPPS